MGSLVARLSAVRAPGRDIIGPMFVIVAKRFASNRLLVLTGATGLIIAVGLVTSIPLYANALATQALRRELSVADGDIARPRAAMLLNYIVGRASSSAPREQFLNVDSKLKEGAAVLPGLASLFTVRSLQTDPFPLLVDGKQGAQETRGEVFFASLESLLQHVDLLEGREPTAGSHVEALISTEGLDELGLAVGATVYVSVPQSGGATSLPVRVVGRWHPKDAADPYWFNRADYYKNALFVSEDAIFEAVVTASPRALREFSWYIVYDPGEIAVSDIDNLLGTLSRVQVDVQQALRGIRIDSPIESVAENYRRKAFFLQILLFVSSASIVGIVLQFVSSSAGMLVERQKEEITMLKSRGATVKHVVGIYLIEWIILGALAILIGCLIGTVLAQFIGLNTGFLVLEPRAPLPVRLTVDVLLYAVAAVGLAILTALLPAVETARHSIVTYKQALARALDKGVVHRYFLDLVPLPLAGYAYFMLLQRQTVLPVGDAGDAFSDPLLLLAPVLFIFAVALIYLRLFPFVVALGARVVSRFPGVSMLMAFRQVHREPRHYKGLLLTLTLTIALGGFSASLAATVDGNYSDAAAYRVGSDLRLEETGVYDEYAQEWTMVPVGDHLTVSGVEATARVLRTTAKERIGTRGGDLGVLGVDPVEFGAVSHWRADYASQPLDTLLSGLAADETGALVDRRLAEAYRLELGDQISLSFKDQTIDFTVAGFLEYFPTLYPKTGRFLVANIDYVFSQLGTQPYEVWLRLKPEVNASWVVDQLRERDVPIIRFEEAQRTLAEKRRDVTRVGTLGILSVGFIIAVLLAVLSLLLHSYISFRRRMQQLGILRAIGLSFRQLMSLYLCEQGLLIMLGALAGTVLGYLASLFFVPFLQIRVDQQSGVPPFLVVVAWEDVVNLYVVLVLFFALALAFNLSLFRRVQIHEAIKFGEERG